MIFFAANIFELALRIPAIYFCNNLKYFVVCTQDCEFLITNTGSNPVDISLYLYTFPGSKTFNFCIILSIFAIIILSNRVANGGWCVAVADTSPSLFGSFFGSK